MNHIAFGKREEFSKPWKVASAWGLSLLLFFGQTVPMLGNPTGGAVVAGAATIGSAGQTLTINQSSQTAIINWQQFSIASGQTTKFLVPNSSSATLNRVLGGNPSLIYGSLQSIGIVYLVNPSGIVVGPNGRIDTASFLASTLDVSNQQFLAGGNMNFTGASNASIDNEGTIHASTGDVYLIANQVNNKGTITAPQGNVGLAAGSDVLFQQAGNQHLFVQATPAGTTRATGVTNAGTIQAAAAELKAAGGNAYALAINNTGSIAATGYKKLNGQVYLTADGGNITNSGKISAQTAGGNGGTIVMNGSGTSSSGTVRNSGTLNASAKVAGGNGGSVTLKNSNGATVNTASGQILATGLSSGQGGTIETSGESLRISGTVSAGKGGSWLLDPSDVTIDNGSGVAPDVNVGTLELALNGGTSETVQAAGGGADSGNIDLNAQLTWTSSATLQLTAVGNINLNQALSATAGTLSLSAGGTVSDTASLAVASFILQNGSWNQSSTSLPAFSATSNFELQGSSTFIRVSGGSGTTGSPYQITDIYGLQGLGSPSGSLLTASAELMNNIDATGTATWNPTGSTPAYAGFVPIGKYDFSNSSDANTYQGTFNGQGYAINGLTINLPSATSGVGLFGDTASASTLENITLTNVSMNGSEYVGGLAGVCNSTVANVSVSGAVTGTTYVGGLMGISSGAISNSYSVASVTGNASGYAIGGLDGFAQYGTITNSYSSGPVSGGSGSSDVGGLLGINSSTISNSFWDTDTAGVTLGVGSDPTNTTAGVTGATTSELESQSYILANAPNLPTWDFTNTWSTNGGTTLPQLIGLSGSSGFDVLSGTAYIGSGTGISTGTTIDLIYNGSLLGYTITNGSGGFSFSVSSADLTGGVLLTDATDRGNTYYQVNSPALTISGIDLWGNTLRVVADAASNNALGQAAGSLSSSGINYLVTYTNNGTYLSTNSGVNMAILSNYTLDGDVTASGTLSTSANSVLTGSAPVTITGSSVAMSGTFNLTGALTVASTAGDIVLDGVGTSASPATAQGITLNSIGAVVLNNSYLATGGNDFTATGTGDATNLDGIDVLNSTINTGVGKISLTGYAGYGSTFSEDTSLTGNSGFIAGMGIFLSGATLQTTSGVICVTGTGDVGSADSPVTVTNSYLEGVEIDGGTIYTVDGAISINGTVANGTATGTLETNEDSSQYIQGGNVYGVVIANGALISSTGNGSVSITGSTAGSIAQEESIGVDLNGGNRNTTGSSWSSSPDSPTTTQITAAGGLGISITGTAGTVSNNSIVGGINVDSPGATGVRINNGVTLTSTGSAPIILTGTGGNDSNTNPLLTQGEAAGIQVEAYGTSDGNLGDGGAADVSIVSANGAITFTGIAGSSMNSIDGISINSSSGGSTYITSSAANIALIGSAPNQTMSQPNSGSGGDTGVDISGENSTSSLSRITTSAGSIYIHGTVSSGTANSKEAGVVLSKGSRVTASGTGGTTGATAQGDVTIVGDTTGSIAQSLDAGVFIEGSGAQVSASGIVADSYGGTGLTITGTSGTINGSAGGTIDQSNNNGAGYFLEPFTAGIAIGNGATIESTGSAPMTLIGTGGTNANTFVNSDNGYVDPSTGGTSGSYGVAIFSPISGQTTTFTSGGLLSITGTAGSSPTTGVGVMIGGPSNAGTVSIASAAAITLVGTGGPGNAEGSSIPNAGVAIFDPGNDMGSVSVAANGGNLSITGTSGGGSNSTGVDGAPYFNSVYNTDSTDPAITTSGSLLVVSTSGLVNTSGWAGEITAQTTSVTAPVGTVSTLTAEASGGPLSLQGGDFTVSGYPNGPLTLATSVVNNLTVTNSGGITISGPITGSGTVNLQDTGGNITFGPGGSISDSGAGNNVILAAGTNLANSHYIINNSTAGANAVQVSGGSFYLFSSNPTGDAFGGITAPAVYNATYSTTGLPAVPQVFYYVASAGSSSPSPIVGIGSLDGGGSDIVPPALIPQLNPPSAPPLGGTSTAPPISFTGNGTSGQTGQQDGGLANSSSNGGRVGPGDAAQLNNGGLNNVANPQASGFLNQALGPNVFHNLQDALANFGDWTSTDIPGSNDTSTASSGDQETVLNGGDVAEIGDKGVKNIALAQAPPQLQNALAGDVLNGLPSGAGH